MFVLFTKSFLTICEHDPIGRIIKSTLDLIWKSSLTFQNTRIPALHYSRRVNRWARSYLLLGLSSHPFLSHHTQVSIPITPWKLSLPRSPYPVMILNPYLTLSAAFDTLSLNVFFIGLQDSSSFPWFASYLTLCFSFFFADSSSLR